MDISNLYNVSSGAVRQSLIGQTTKTVNEESGDLFAAMLDDAVKNLSNTNAYISDAENEEIRFALGETDSTHDLTIALQKASTALSYTVAIRDRFLSAYNEIMQIQI
ncbi:MAG: flagellar hook-basal body complex protein FliE [Lachnospiraceae bacterium]|nr:flagellar hook-basal body complex protein FliE [Lachnospiraceae bacterium]